jgi:hypothetical protein
MYIPTASITASHCRLNVSGIGRENNYIWPEYISVLFIRVQGGKNIIYIDRLDM